MLNPLVIFLTHPPQLSFDAICFYYQSIIPRPKPIFSLCVQMSHLYVLVSCFFRSTCSLQLVASGGTLPRSTGSTPHKPSSSHCSYFVQYSSYTYLSACQWSGVGGYCFSPAYVCVSVCLCTQKLKKLEVCIILNPSTGSGQILLTFDLDFGPWEKITYHVKTAGPILKQLYTIMHHIWFCKWNKNGRIWPWLLNLRAFLFKCDFMAKNDGNLQG